MPSRTESPSASPGREWWWIFDPRCSLRARAALMVAGGTVAFTLLLSWITGTLYQRAIEPQLAARFETLAFQVSDKLDRAVYERYRTLLLAASLATIRDPAAPAAERRRVLELMQEITPDFAWVGLTDASGRIAVATNQYLEGTPAEARSWFRGGRESPFVGPLREIPDLSRAIPASDDGETSKRFLDVAVPVTSATGQFGGVLAAHVRWNWAREVQTSVVPESAAREQVGVTLYGPAREVLLDSGASGWTQPPDAPEIADGRRFRGSTRESVGGTTYLTGFSRSRGHREYRGIGWLVVVRQPADRAFVGVRALRRGIILWGSVIVVTATFAAWILAGRHARRLRSVRAAAERIQEGDILTVLPHPRDRSELAAMCGALDNLVEELRAKEEKLLAENSRLAAQLRENDGAKR